MSHRTFWVESWPERRQAADWFDPVLARRRRVVQRVFTLVHRTDVGGQGGQRAAPRRRPPRRRAPGRRRRPHPLRRLQARKADAVDEREHELADGHVPVAYVGLVTITIARRPTVWTGRRALKRRCARHRVLLRPLWGRMELGYAAALPIGLGLSREPF